MFLIAPAGHAIFAMIYYLTNGDERAVYAIFAAYVVYYAFRLAEAVRYKEILGFGSFRCLLFGVCRPLYYTLAVLKPDASQRVNTNQVCYQTVPLQNQG